MAHTGLFVAPVAGATPVGMSPTDGRLVLGALYGTTSQLVSGGAFTPSASAMTATVAQAVWQLSDVTNTAATFLSPTDLANLTFAAAPGTGGRWDLVCVKQNNVENADADSRSNVTVVTGTASGSPVVPPTPAGATVYLKILISAGQTNLAAAAVTNLMQTAFRAPDLIATTSAALNTFTGSTGQHATVYNDSTTTNNGDYAWNGTGWDFIGVTAWKTYTPVWTASTTNPTLGTSTLRGKYRLVGKTVEFEIYFLIAAGSGVGSGNWRFSLPFTPSGDRVPVPVHVENATVGFGSGVGFVDTNAYVDQITYGGSTLGSGSGLNANSKVSIRGSYEIA